MIVGIAMGVGGARVRVPAPPFTLTQVIVGCLMARALPAPIFAELVQEMVESDYRSAKCDSLVKLAGFQAYDYNE